MNFNNQLHLISYRYSLPFCVALGIGVITTSSFAAEEAEFDPSFLHSVQGKNAIDIRRFNYGNPIPEGKYYADIYLNNEWKGKANVQYLYTDNANTSTLCLTPELLSLIDVVKGTVPENSYKATCYPASEGLPSAKFHFDLSTLKLNIEIPQAQVNTRPRGYIAPAQWQSGVPAAFVNYDVNYYQYNTPDINNEQTYLGLKAGLNLWGWAFRHRGGESWNNGHSTGYQNIETNVTHDIARLRAQFTLGDFYTNGELMDSLSLRGIRLASDERMLPNSLRGYAPIVRGIANSNAKVTIYQNAQILYETTVPAGPFVINDLYPSGYAGDLLVQITESNGQTRTFTVPFASVAQLIRPGFSRWQMSVGRYRYANETYHDLIAQGTYQYGLTNDITLNSGLTTSSKYTAGLAGVAFNTPIGAIASDITLSRTTFNHSNVTRKGYSLHTSYSVNIPTTSTNITLAAYRYSSKDFYHLKDALLANHSEFIDDVSIKSAAFYRPKNQFQVSINQELGEKWGNIFLTGTTYNYWEHKGSRNEYQMGYSHFWKKLGYQIGFSQSRDNEQQRRDDRFYVNFTLPLGERVQSPIFSTVLNYNKGEKNSIQTSISGIAGEDNQFSYGISGNSQESGPSGYAMNGGYRSPYVNVTATVGQDTQHNRQMSLGASGAVVVHPYGVTLSNDLSDTFTIIHAKGAQGAVINNAPGSRLDFWGNGIVPYVTPYEKNQISIDPTNLDLNVELSATEQEIIPRANSATLVTFNTQTGRSLLFDIRMPDGSTPPMASEVLDEHKQLVGYVAQAGRLFTRGLPKQGQLDVIWGPNHDDKCSFTYHATRNETDMRPQTIPVQCIPHSN
ncbi:fimbria/pilus outer membrane usher protein [Proteus mirabilis]|uniref:fimbria/pilus outer membrane usher protein n=1 Tax=Proteus mirabilis TaxID=584 RepID=UPI0016264D65|nr:fimbria/pilus outer membrane usher protein [Proteus mirabilis]MBB6652282.1 fimbrial biogenesis outer membrane usher protein [Proteus mirabilis]